MNDLSKLRLEFRIPISPTPGFFSQVRFFVFALRRLGGAYASARVTVIVGNDCDIDHVKEVNAWSSEDNVVWQSVPQAVFAEFNIHGTANWRLCVEDSGADVILFCDADTVLLRDIDPLLADFPLEGRVVAGHMAHLPPPSTGGDMPPSNTVDYWRQLFAMFDAPWPTRLHNYSMDAAGRFDSVPFYPNLGFLALTPEAANAFGAEVFAFERVFKTKIKSGMRCQIAIAVLSAKLDIQARVLPAPYNAANDVVHLGVNAIEPGDIRLLHYLRERELTRQRDLLPENLDEFIARPIENPATRLLQKLVQEYRASMA